MPDIRTSTLGCPEISEVLLSWIRSCPYIPTIRGKRVGVEYEFLQDSRVSMSVSSNPVSIVVDEDILGNSILQHSVGIYLRVTPDGSKDKTDAEKTLTNIAGWAISPDNYPSLGDSFEIISIKQTTTPNRILIQDDGSSDYQVTLEIQYTTK